MRRIAFIQAAAVLAVSLILGAAPAMATPAGFDPVFGFDGDDLGGLPSINMGPSDPFLGAGEGAGLDVELTGSTDVCILFGDDTCRANTLGITGPYSVLVTLTVSAINTPEIDGPFTLFLTGLFGNTYSTDEVVVELNPVVPGALDTAAVPSFIWGASFDPLVHVVDNGAPPNTYHYVGWQVMLGDSVTFQYDVLESPAGRGTPQFMANATTIVPEPGTALLMGLGLIGLATGSARLKE